ncbi:MAG: lysylphosphatidylglycerol synthase transmembrane domain-containing protein [Thermotogota bacterium]
MNTTRTSIRRWLFWLAVVGFAWFLLSRLGDLRHLAATLAGGHWPWLLLAAASQVGYFVFFAWMFQVAFSTVGVKGRVVQLVPVVLAAVFANTLAPSGGTAGLALYADDAVRRGQSGAQATAGALLATVIDFFAFAVVLLAGMGHLLAHNALHAYEVAAAALMTLVSAAQVGALVLALGHPTSLRRGLAFLQRTITTICRRLRRPSPVHANWADVVTAQLANAAGMFKNHPGRIAYAFFIGVASNAVSLGTLYFLFRAFDQPPTLGVLVSGYAMAILFLNVSPVPQGLGVVEGLMTLVLATLGIPNSPALAITLAFRGISLWIPILLGFLLLRFVPSFSPKTRKETPEPPN